MAVRRDAGERGTRRRAARGERDHRSPSSTQAPTSRTPTSPPSRRRPGTSSTTERAVADKDGHGTFVSALAAGSVTNDGGHRGLRRRRAAAHGQGRRSFGHLQRRRRGGGDRLRGRPRREDHQPQPRRRRRLGARGAGNRIRGGARRPARGGRRETSTSSGNPIEYPAAALQPPGSNGQGGVGLSVAASTMAGKRASFSNTGSHISLAAPGENVFGAIAAGSSRIVVAALQRFPAPMRACTGGRAAHPSRRPRSPARPRSCGPRTRR